MKTFIFCSTLSRAVGGQLAGFTADLFLEGDLFLAAETGNPFENFKSKRRIFWEELGLLEEGRKPFNHFGHLFEDFRLFVLNLVVVLLTAVLVFKPLREYWRIPSLQVHLPMQSYVNASRIKHIQVILQLEQPGRPPSVHLHVDDLTNSV